MPSRFLAFIVLLCLSSCSKDNGLNCFREVGEPSVEQRILSTFAVLQIETALDLIIVKDTNQWCEVYAGEHMMSGIETSINDDTLLVRDNNKCNFARSAGSKAKIVLHTTDFSGIEYRGSGYAAMLDNFTATTFEVNVRDVSGDININVSADSLIIKNHTGGAQISIRGSSRYTYIFQNANGPIEGASHLAHEAEIDTRGTNAVSLAVDSLLSYKMLGSGDLIIFGSPLLLSAEDNGSGQVYFR